jgi:CRISPR-associated exonuclease Cas4
MVISVSLLSSYLYCPRKIFLERVLGLYEPPKESLVIGTIKHEIYDSINKKEEAIVTSISKETSFDELQDTYKKSYSAILRQAITTNREKLNKIGMSTKDAFKRLWPLILNEAQSRASNISSFMQSHLVFGRDLWRMLTPKIYSEFQIRSEKIGLSGIIDQLEVYEAGYIPVELKSGTPPEEGAWPNHKIQIAAYAMLLEEQHNTEIKEGFVYYIDANERRHIPINVFLKDEIRHLLKQVNALLESRTIPSVLKNKNKCSSCGLKHICHNEKRLKGLQKESLKIQGVPQNNIAKPTHSQKRVYV